MDTKEYAIEINLIEVTRSGKKNKNVSSLTLQVSYSGTFTGHLPTARYVMGEVCKIERSLTQAERQNMNSEKPA